MNRFTRNLKLFVAVWLLALTALPAWSQTNLGKAVSAYPRSYILPDNWVMLWADPGVTNYSMDVATFYSILNANIFPLPALTWMSNQIVNWSTNAAVSLETNNYVATDASKKLVPTRDGSWWTNLHALAAINVKAAPFNAKGDGSTDDTAAIQAAMTALQPGQILSIPGGTYLVGNLKLSNKTNNVICGPGTLKLTGTAAILGLEITNACENVTITGLEIVGDGNTNNHHAGVYMLSGATVKGLKVRDCYIHHTTIGVSLNANLGGTVQDCEVSGNLIERIVGTASGSGYGIHHANSTNYVNNVLIRDNRINDVDRHAIYQARGRGVELCGNQIRDYRKTLNTPTLVGNNPWCVVIGRSRDVNFHHNLIADFYDGAAIIWEDGSSGTYNIKFNDNILSTSKTTTPWLLVGSTLPSVERYPENVEVRGNLFESDLPTPILTHGSGKTVVYANNHFRVSSNTNYYYLVSLAMSDESGGTTNYSDWVTVEDNVVHQVSPTAEVTFCYAQTNASIFGGRVTVRNNRVNRLAEFVPALPVTNKNFVVGNRFSLPNGREWIEIGTYPSNLFGMKADNPLVRIWDTESGYSAAEALYQAGDSDAAGNAELWWRWGYSGGSWVLRNNITGTTNQYMTIDLIGRVGLGTASPQQTLHVAGNAIAGIYYGDGSGLSNLNASALSSGTVPLGRISGITSNQVDAATDAAYRAQGSSVDVAAGSGVTIVTNGSLRTISASLGGNTKTLDSYNTVGGTIPMTADIVKLLSAGHYYLPLSSSHVAKSIVLKNWTGSGNCEIRHSTESIDGAPAYFTLLPNEGRTFYSTGGDWMILDR